MSSIADITHYMEPRRTGITPAVRDAATWLLVAMHIGARGHSLKERTLRLLNALGCETIVPMASISDAVRVVLAAATACNAIPRHICAALETANIVRLQRLVDHLGGGPIKCASLQDSSARLYVIVLCLARANESSW